MVYGAALFLSLCVCATVFCYFVHHFLCVVALAVVAAAVLTHIDFNLILTSGTDKL